MAEAPVGCHLGVLMPEVGKKLRRTAHHGGQSEH